jgi:hypothetical protein
LIRHLFAGLSIMGDTAARPESRVRNGGAPCTSTTSASTAICHAFERTSKRRRGYPSETHVKRGVRIVHGNKELTEKLGRNDLCPCGSNKRFQVVLHALRPLLTA